MIIDLPTFHGDVLVSVTPGFSISFRIHVWCYGSSTNRSYLCFSLESSFEFVPKSKILRGTKWSLKGDYDLNFVLKVHPGLPPATRQSVSTLLPFWCWWKPILTWHRKKKKENIFIIHRLLYRHFLNEFVSPTSGHTSCWSGYTRDYRPPTPPKTRDSGPTSPVDAKGRARLGKERRVRPSTSPHQRTERV